MPGLIYNALYSIGFTHPLHPIATHIPMGMILGGFLFKLASYKWKELSKTAYYCFLLALIIAPITVVSGLMDWQQHYAGKLNLLIFVKFILASLAIILLSAFVYLYNRKNPGGKTVLFLYFLCFLIVLGLGFMGGQLVYG